MTTSTPPASYLGHHVWKVGDTSGSWHTCYRILTHEHGMSHSGANFYLVAAYQEWKTGKRESQLGTGMLV